MNTPEPSDSNEFYAIMNTLGHASLLENLKFAAYYLHHSSDTIHKRNWKITITEARSCYLFIQGTGLEVMLNNFGLYYNADEIRRNFDYLVRHS